MVFVYFAVEQLGIKPLLPAYLDPSLNDQELLTGVNFATGAAGWDPLTAELSVLLLLSLLFIKLAYGGDVD